MTEEPDVTFYVDTNFFIELRDLGDLPWRELSPEAKRIEVAVARAVISELDRMKEDRSNDRRRNRSRLAFRYIDEAVNGDNFRAVIRQSSPVITLRVCSCVHMAWDEHSSLDRHRADDNLVMCALSEQISGSKYLLSLDRGPRISARLAGLSVIEPPSSWRIDDADSPESNEIKKLKRELAETRATKPEVSLAVADGDGPKRYFEFSYFRVPKLASGLLTELVEEEQVGDHADGWRRGEYLEKYRDYLGRLHTSIEIFSTVHEFTILLKNDSRVTAKKLLLKVLVPEGTLLIGAEKNVETLRASLIPPTLPELKRNPNYLSDLNWLPPVHRGREEPRDPTGFYWQDRPQFDGRSASVICEEFRPQQEFEDHYWVRLLGMDSLSGSIEVKATATNLSHPVEVQVGLKFVGRDMTWKSPEVLALLPKWLAKRISEY